MADILLNNAIQELANSFNSTRSAIDYNKLLGTSLNSYLDDFIRNNVNLGPWAGLTVNTNSLYQLSCANRLTSCNCNFSGSGTSSTNCQNGTDNNPWKNDNVLIGATQIGINEVIDAILSGSGSLNQLYTNGGLSTEIDNDLAIEWYALNNIYVNDNETEILTNWYGVGVTVNNPGAPISSDNRIKVCGSEWKSGQGASCTWTVPAGATQAKFQVWGAGGGSNPACCCGGVPSGPTGAYAEIVIDVTAGNTYTVCAGCACSRYCCSNTAPGPGCMSGVTGTGICCLKADGGSCCNSPRSNMYYVRQIVGEGMPGGACCRFQNFYCTDSGPCWCNAGAYCYDNSCATCGVVGVYPDCCDWSKGCSCGNIDTVVSDGINSTHRGLLGGGCLETNNYGYHVRPPVIDSDTGKCFAGGCQIQTFSSGTNCGGCNGKDWTYHPGMGGAGTHIMGGTNDHKGDTGRGGMVQISWV